ncbi:neuroblastoma suppressor of tumorigenicity 1-like [Amphiura filiformis]|uniref:neuroblastoma suppressor of tumorigenicity 1-like n=1 Tax=Amphiura filiformis TaxID=82378 RepID=UPI003B216EAA
MDKRVLCIIILGIICIIGVNSASAKGRSKNHQRRNHGNADRNHGNTEPDQGERGRTVSSLPMFSDKKSWCEPRSIRQVIDHPGCTAKTISNLICLGQCYSYSIPRTLPEETTAELQYCDSCQPSRATWQKIPLECTIDNVPYVDKLVEIVQDCACRSCYGPDHSTL